MNASLILRTKRNNERPHTKDELEWWISEYTKGNIPEYQMSAWLMAVCWRGMTTEETAILTTCMVQSGKRVSWEKIKLKHPTMCLVDKHSTGGIGDKVSLVLAPLVACLGVSVPMMAGRGLGHTGGTIDKLESIPGYQTSLPTDDFQRIVAEVGCSIVSASEDMCLADEKLYALRDVTETVTSIPLITSSIMSKKIAENPDALILDVKYGRAAFNPTIEDAIALGESMIRTGEANDVVPTTALLTRMDSVLGHAVGNWNEVQECLELMKTGKGHAELRTLIVVQAAQMIWQSTHTTHSKYATLEEAIDIVLDALTSGKAYPYFQKMVKAHGGDVSVCDNPDSYPHTAKHTKSVLATRTGWISDMNGLVIGNVAVDLGAGRQTTDEDVDPIAGIWFHSKVGAKVVEGETVICTVSTNRSQEVLDMACNTLSEKAIFYSNEPTVAPPIITHKMSSTAGLIPFTIPTCLASSSEQE